VLRQSALLVARYCQRDIFFMRTFAAMRTGVFTTVSGIYGND